MEFKKLVFVLTIALVLIIGGMWGTTYAYYVSTGGPQVNITTGDFDTGLAVVFSQNEYINMKTGVPIAAADVNAHASKSIFTLVPDSTLLDDADVAINVSLDNITIDDALKVSDFKYRFVCNDGTTSTTLVNGNGTDFTSSVMSMGTLSLGSLSTSDNNFDANKQYTCTLSVWLQESGNDQNDLMNKKFGGLVKVGIAIKK